jgi:hypothetical protein
MSSGTISKGKIKETRNKKDISDNKYNPIVDLFSKFYSRSFLTRDTYFDVSTLVVSFLNLSKKKGFSRDYYANNTKISFQDIDPEFQQSLKQEFASAMNDFSRYFKC